MRDKVAGGLSQQSVSSSLLTVIIYVLRAAIHTLSLTLLIKFSLFSPNLTLNDTNTQTGSHTRASQLFNRKM